MTLFRNRPRLTTFLLAGVGVAAFEALSLPLPFLFGPMFACLFGALAGLKLKGAGPVSAGARTILGVAVGASITPAVVAQLPVMALSVALVPVYVAVIGLIGVPYFTRICRYDKVTAYYAAMPGGLQDMVLFGQEAGGNVRSLSLVHATRVLIIVTLAPIVITWFMGATLSHPIGQPATDIPVHELVIMAVAALIGWKAGERIGLFGASIIGPLILTGVLSLAGVIHYRPPAEAILAAQFFIGMGIGVYYVGVTVAELRRDVFSGIGFVFILAILAAIFAEIVYLLELAPPLEGFMAFAPGGQAEMTVLAIIAGADLGYVVVHHLTRLVVVITGAPIAAKLYGVRSLKNTPAVRDGT